MSNSTCGRDWFDPLAIFRMSCVFESQEQCLDHSTTTATAAAATTTTTTTTRRLFGSNEQRNALLCALLIVCLCWLIGYLRREAIIQQVFIQQSHMCWIVKQQHQAYHHNQHLDILRNITIASRLSQQAEARWTKTWVGSQFLNIVHYFHGATRNVGLIFFVVAPLMTQLLLILILSVYSPSSENNNNDNNNDDGHQQRLTISPNDSTHEQDELEMLLPTSTCFLLNPSSI